MGWLSCLRTFSPFVLLQLFVLVHTCIIAFRTAPGKTVGVVVVYLTDVAAHVPALLRRGIRISKIPMRCMKEALKVHVHGKNVQMVLRYGRPE